MLRKLISLLGLLLLTGCTTPTGQDTSKPERPVALQPVPIAPAPLRPRPLLTELQFGELRSEAVPQEKILILPSTPRITARVANTQSVRWLVHAGGGMDPFPPLLETLRPRETAPGEWVLEWTAPPTERVRLSLCAEVAPDYPDEPDLVRDGGTRCVVIAAQTIQALAPGASPYITRERALEVARPVQPDANWNTRFDAAREYAGKSNTKRPTWIVEAVFTYGNRLVVYVDALTGQQLGVMQAEPPHFPDAPKPIDREKAILAALEQVKPADIEVSEAVFQEGYRIFQQEYHVWVVKLVTRKDKRHAGSVIVHAYTGQVLEQTSPPAEQ